MTKEEWEKEKPVEGVELKIDVKWFYLFYKENIKKSPLDINMDENNFGILFNNFINQLRIEQMFMPVTEGSPKVFNSGRSYYISVDSIINKVVNYFNNKTDW